MQYIILSNKKQVIVDDEDYEHLSRHGWHQANGYACRHISSIPDIREYMHRAVNNTPEGFVTDHINGNKLDNRKANLRTADTSQNAMNYSKKSGAANPYRGVSLHKKSGLWRARVMIHKKEVLLGYFKTPEEAKQARDEGATMLFKEFAKT
jgi:hypothetical protein